MYTRFVLLTCLLLAGSFAHARILLDQSQLVYGSGFAIGPSNQRLAQTFRVGIDGYLTHVNLSVACYSEGSYTVTASIHPVGSDGLPTDTVLASVPAIDSSALPGFGDHTLTAFPLTSPLPVTHGDHLAIVLQASPYDAQCEAYSSAGDDVYPNGSLTFQADPNPPGWMPVGGDRDLVFQTFVDDGVQSGLCEFRTADGMNNDFVPNDVPICRCLQDPQLAQQRCSFQLPDAIVFSELPLYFDPKVTARWSVEPLIDPGTATSIEVKSLTGDLGGKAVVIHARKPLQSETVRSQYYATSPKAFNQMLITIDVGGHSYEFENTQPPMK